MNLTHHTLIAADLQLHPKAIGVGWWGGGGGWGGMGDCSAKHPIPSAEVTEAVKQLHGGG